MSQMKVLYIAAMAALFTGMCSAAIDRPEAQAFAGQDLHVRGDELISSQTSSGKSILVFQKNFSMAIGANTFRSESAVVWLQSIASDYSGRLRVDYYAQVYMEGDVSVQKGATAQTTDISTMRMKNGQSLVARFVVTGDVFATADTRTVGEPNGLAIYARATDAFTPVKYEPFVDPEAAAPSEKSKSPSVSAAVPPQTGEPVSSVGSRTPTLLEEFFMPAGSVAAHAVRPVKEEKTPAFEYPVNISPATEVKPKIES
ncbi:MAG: hypothetical protein Q7T18_04830, partial [Sedimentisphaerales bacterium]|nr:hypothetical protein [Sedimentisphaerales bacterium]